MGCATVVQMHCVGRKQVAAEKWCKQVVVQLQRRWNRMWTSLWVRQSGVVHFPSVGSLATTNRDPFFQNLQHFSHFFLRIWDTLPIFPLLHGFHRQFWSASRIAWMRSFPLLLLSFLNVSFFPFQFLCFSDRTMWHTHRTKNNKNENICKPVDNNSLKFTIN